MSIHRSIYMLWLGPEEWNETRKKALHIPHTLITKDNLDQYIKEPLHPAYPFLSTVHKSDYLRCYLMHHYGGGYSDIKYTTIDWNHAFDVMDMNPTIELMGVQTIHGHTYAGIEIWSEELKTSILQHMNSLVCMGYMICRPYSTITTKWYHQLHLTLDHYLDQLVMNPAKHTRECFDPHLGYAMTTPKWEGNSEYRSMYSISWNRLLSQLLYPIQLEHLDKVDHQTMIHTF